MVLEAVAAVDGPVVARHERDLRGYDTTERDFAQFCSRGDIIPKGRIDNQQTLLKIYKAVEAARDVDRCIKLCVRDNLKAIGVNI